MQNKAVFIDRDGTINIDGPYLADPDKFQMYPGVGEGVGTLRKYGFKIIVITNQSGIGRGYFTEKDLLKIHEKMKKEFQRFHTKIDGIYYCPHRPDENCECRKPKTKLFEQAIYDHNIDVKKSYMIGDKMQDVEAGKKMGVKTILIPLANKENIGTIELKPDYVAVNFTEAVEWILGKNS
jgi:D,D-heptose 1,7-bisphosphate phosphatase